ncbi:MAG: minor capsid protein [Spirochaetota bacterium]
MSANEKLQDKSISHATFMERYKTQVVNDILESLKDSERNLVNRIRDRLDDESFTRQRLERLLEDIKAITKEGNQVLRERLRETVKEFGEREAKWTAGAIGESMPIEWNIAQPSPSQIYAAVVDRPLEDRMFDEAMRGVGENQRQRIQAALRRGFTEGQTVQEIVRSIRGTRKVNYTDGILGRSRREITGLVRTAINHTHSVARDELVRENRDLIKGVQWVATLDSRTTLICASRDGKVFDPDEGPRPPAHFNCRSTVVPVLRSWRELGIDLDEAPEGTRASMDGQVPAKTTFPQWLERQSAETQREVLGRARYKRWKEGESIDRFVQDGRRLTLDELERREGGEAA